MRKRGNKMEKICAVYKIVNEVTGDSYIGSSRNIYKRWASHKEPSKWKEHPNSKLYQDMQKYGVDKFRFQILVPVMEEYLKQVEQELIEMLNPTYNNYNAKGLDVERRKETKKRYRQSEKRKEIQKKYEQSEKGKETHRKYQQSEKGKETHRKYQQSEKGKEVSRKYHNQLCLYNGETLTLNALSKRFRRAGIPHATIEAKKYLI